MLRKNITKLSHDVKYSKNCKKYKCIPKRCFSTSYTKTEYTEDKGNILMSPRNVYRRSATTEIYSMTTFILVSKLYLENNPSIDGIVIIICAVSMLTTRVITDIYKPETLKEEKYIENKLIKAYVIMIVLMILSLLHENNKIVHDIQEELE